MELGFENILELEEQNWHKNWKILKYFHNGGMENFGN